MQGCNWHGYQVCSTLKADEETSDIPKTAEILYQSRALLASWLNSSRDGIAAMQAVRDLITGEIEDFRYLLVNPVFAKLLGKKTESSGKSE